MRVLETKKGFTLIEIVVLLAIIGIVISGVLVLFLNSISVNKTASYYSTAYKLLDSKIESYRNIPFDSVNSETFQISQLPQGQGVLTVSNQIDGSPQADIKSVDLRINWNFKKPTSVRIVTYINRKGLQR